MRTLFTISDIQQSKVSHLNAHLFGNKTLDKKSPKYRNKKTEVDGIVFDSAKEAKRYKELKMLLKAGLIAFLELQKEYELNQGGTHSLKYVADFVYMDSLTGKTIVNDVKGFRTKEYKKKKRLMKEVWGIYILET